MLGNAKEVRAHFADYIARAERGEEIVITRNGQVVARLPLGDCAGGKLHLCYGRRRFGADCSGTRFGNGICCINSRSKHAGSYLAPIKNCPDAAMLGEVMSFFK